MLHETESPISPRTIASTWLQDLSLAISAGDSEAVASAFLEAGWLRDILVFTWNNRSLCGYPKIKRYLEGNLKRDTLSSFELDNSPGLGPAYGEIFPNGVSSGFTFRTPMALGQGYFNLLQDEQGKWKAMTALFMMKDLIGHEESGPEEGTYEGHTRSWADVNDERRSFAEERPHVLILGAGQNGLNVAARFRQMNIPTIVLEQNNRVGDNWRKRYPTLSLHTPRAHHTMLYKPYPETWPIYTPRDKLSSWLEEYALSQDLVIWTRSTILPTPTYDETSKTWTVVVSRDGEHMTLHPAHIVLATGTLGAPRIPTLGNTDLFKGRQLHASKYSGGREFSGKRVIVIGAGNTSADICQDLAFCGAQVTMVQRSSTCVVSRVSSSENLNRRWPEGVPTHACDLKFVSTPLPLIGQLAASHAEQLAEREKSMHDGLKRAGLNVNLGPQGAGNFLLVFRQLGGYWLDVGCADLISSGRVKIKQGVEPTGLGTNSMMFSDGSSLAADAIVFATGYHNIRETMRQIFGDKTMNMTSPVWDLDEEGELRGSYRPSGHPALWYAPGDFFCSRFFSKQLALLIKAIEMGLTKTAALYYKEGEAASANVKL